MRPCLFLLCFAVLSGGVMADTIVLKNGRRIAAGKVTQEEKRVVYETDQGTFSLPRSIVERVEHDGAAPSAAGNEARIPALTRAAPPDRVIVEGHVDRRYLDDMARQPALSPRAKELLVASYLSAVEFEVERGRLDEALDLAKRAVTALPEDPRLLLGQAVVLIQQQELRQAREVLLRARSLAPDSAEVLKFLGFVEYRSDRLDEAVRTWTKAETLAKDKEVEQLLERAKRETAVEGEFLEASSPHFTLRFEGRQISQDFRSEILETMENQYRDLERTVEVSPREPILVILYTSQAFSDVTQAPSWSGALNDGKIRVPIEGLDHMTPALRSVLVHEMTHSFVRYRSRGRCPAWLNEGWAQLSEGKSTAVLATRLIEVFRKGNRISLSALEDPFTGMDPATVPVAYAESLAAVELLRDRQGMSEVGRLLDRMATGVPADAALRGVFSLSVTELDAGLWPYLEKKAVR